MNVIPDFLHPIPSAIHPFWPAGLLDMEAPNELEITTRHYADRFRLYDDENQRLRLHRIYCGWLGALMYPQGPIELLQIGVDFCTWAFAFDDEYCDEGPVARDPARAIPLIYEIMRQFESPEHEVSRDRYARAARDLRVRLDRHAPPERVGRFTESFRIYMLAEMWGVVHLKPSVSDYVTYRQQGGGAFAFPAIAHVISGAEVSQREYEDRRVRALCEMLNSLMAWDTEPFAYFKEKHRTLHKDHNLITAIETEKGCSFEEAIEYWLHMRQCTISLFRRLWPEVDKTASQGLKDYLGSLMHYCRGATDWTVWTHRYSSFSGHGADDEEAAYVGGRMLDGTPEETFASLVEIDSIAWWWHYDPARR